MKQFLIAVTLAGILATGAWSTEARAEGGYFGLAYNKATVDFDGVGEADIGVLDARFGRMVNDYIGIEGRIGLGMTDDDMDVCYYYYCADITVGLQHYVGAYMRAHFTPPGGFTPYLLLGVSQGTLEVSASGYSEDDSDTDVSFGLGFDIGNEGGAFTIEYASLFDKDGVALNGISVGFVTRF